MASQDNILQALQHQKLLPLFYHADKEVCISVVKTLYAAGIRVVEFTNRGSAAFENFEALVSFRKAEMKDMLLAVGTIKNVDDATKYIDAGADFLVSPVFDEGVCQTSKYKNVLWVPGCMTPSEIHVAETAGCKLVKLFPGNVLGPGFISSVKELFPNMLFMPTGGVEVTSENIHAWLNAGACAVGMGSKLISTAILNQKDYFKLKEQTENILSLISNSAT